MPDYREHLEQKVLPFWRSLKDEESGGFFGYVSNQLEVQREAPKGCILNSRILWTFSTAARVFKKNSDLKYAKAAFDFLTCFEDKLNGGMYWSVSRNGVPADTTKHTYCQAFAVYGLSAYYRATKDKEALNKALAIFRLIESRCRDKSGYLESFQADFTPEKNDKLSENGIIASRTMNTLLHVLEAYVELYKASQNAEVREWCIQALERFYTTLYNPAKNRLEVFFDNNYHSLLDMQSYGHDIEASWLLWDAAQTVLPESKLAPYRNMCISLAESVFLKAFTDHGLKNEAVNDIQNEERIWWVQAEAVLGFQNAYSLTEDKKYKKAAQAIWSYIQSCIVDRRQNSEWFWSVNERGIPTDKPIVEEWKCPYHNSRMCILMSKGDAPID